MGKITLPAILTMALVILIIIGGVHYRLSEYTIKPHPDTTGICCKVDTTKIATYQTISVDSLKPQGQGLTISSGTMTPTVSLDTTLLEYTATFIDRGDTFLFKGLPRPPKGGYKIEIISSRKTTICPETIRLDSSGMPGFGHTLPHLVY